MGFRNGNHKGAQVCSHPSEKLPLPFPFCSKKDSLVLLLCSHTWECVDDGEHILKATPVLHLANRGSHATPCVFGDLCRSYFILVLEIKLSYSNMQSQNLLRLFIPVLSLTLEDFLFLVPECFLSELKLVAAYPAATENKLFPFSYKAFLKGQISHCYQSSFLQPKYTPLFCCSS